MLGVLKEVNMVLRETQHEEFRVFHANARSADLEHLVEVRQFRYDDLADIRVAVRAVHGQPKLESRSINDQQGDGLAYSSDHQIVPAVRRGPTAVSECFNPRSV